MASTWLSFRKRFPLKGEGTIIVHRTATAPFGIKIKPTAWPPLTNQADDSFVALQITEKGGKFWGKSQKGVPALLLSEKDGVGYESTKKVSYWFSFNRDDRVLKYGKGYIMEGATCMAYEFPKVEEPDQWASLFDPATHKTIEIVEDCGNASVMSNNLALKPMEDAEKSVNFYPYPLIKDWPYVVKDSTTATMFDIACDNYILSASLPAACQELYRNVASPNVDLDWPENVSEYKLSDAIGYSIVTKGKLLYNKLKEKKEQGEFTYLRVTLGYDRGSSPGIPYVLEIWPAQSKSAIHNHGNAYAVIKVLHGAINIGIYNKTWPDSEGQAKLEEIKSFTASEGAITWLSPNWYQTHQLRNLSTDEYCATIQCYKYGDEDQLMWPYFDYLEGTHIEEFQPDTDFDFVTMREIVLQEYAESQSKKSTR